MRRVFNGDGRSDRQAYLLAAGPAIATLVIGGSLFSRFHTIGESDFALVITIPMLFFCVAVTLFAVARRLHDLGRSVLWFSASIVLVQFVAIAANLAGFDTRIDQIGLAVAGLGFAYLVVAPGEPGPNIYGPEPARWLGAPIALPALALYTQVTSDPAASSAEQFAYCVEPDDLQTVIVRARLSHGEATFVDSEGGAFSGVRSLRRWRAEYSLQRLAAVPFSELKTRVAAAYARGMPWWYEDRRPPQSHIDLTKRTLAAFEAAQTLDDIFAAFHLRRDLAD